MCTILTDLTGSLSEKEMPKGGNGRAYPIPSNTTFIDANFMITEPLRSWRILIWPVDQNCYYDQDALYEIL